MIYSLKINMEGCVNTLSSECASFYGRFGRDGRNGTSSSVFACFVDKEEDFVVVHFDRRRSATLLLALSVAPAVALIASCVFLCVANGSVRVADDGRMRLVCCGRIRSGTGNVRAFVHSEKGKKAAVELRRLLSKTSAGKQVNDSSN
jgi:hypothetical protein